MLAYFATYACSLYLSTTSDLQWRLPLALQAVPAGIMGLMLFLCPESFVL
jgi:hypothetical protein